MTTTPPPPSPGRDALPPERVAGEGYRGRDLSGLDLRGAALEGLSFIQADLQRTRLSGAALSAAQLHGARLREADLSDAKADAIGAREADLEGATLRGADLRGAQLIGAVLLDADLSGANLAGADLRGADLRSADLSGADLSGADIGRADLEGAKLDGVVLDAVRASGARIANVSGLSGEQTQQLLDAGAYSGFIPQLTDRLQQLARQIQAVLPAPSPPEEPPPAAAAASPEPGLLADLRARTAALQEQIQRRQQRAEVVRKAQEAEWRARQEKAAEERRYRRENREEWRQEQEQKARVARERLRAVRQERRRLRALEQKTEARASQVLRRAQQEARARVDAAAQLEASRQQSEVAARRAASRAERLDALTSQRDAARQRADALREAVAAHQQQQQALAAALAALDVQVAADESAVAALQQQLREAARQQAALERQGLLLTRRRRDAERDRAPTDALDAQLDALEEAVSAAAAERNALADQMAALQDQRIQRQIARAEREVARAAEAEAASLKAAEQLTAAAEAERLERQRSRLAATPAVLPSPTRRALDRWWYALTDRLAQSNPQAAVQLDRLRDQVFSMPSRLRQRAEGSPAEQLRAAERRRARVQDRLLDAPAAAGDQQRAAEARMAAALERPEDDAPELPIPAQEAPGLLGTLLNGFWYRLTDLLAVVSPSGAEALDRAKARVEWEVVSRRDAARRARALQEHEAATAIQQQRRQDQDKRLVRLSRIREREEQRAQQRAEVEARRTAAQAEQQRRAALRALSPAERHARVRERYAALTEHTGVNHRGADLRGKRLTEVEWSDADLRDARLDAARLDNADLIAARMERASMEGARLSGATLDGAYLHEARLSGARLRRASLLGAQLRGARLIDADLRGADLTGADLAGADLTGADLRKAALFGANLAGANLTAARMTELELDGAVLDRAVLDQADLSGVRWEGASVEAADLSGALGLSSIQREQLRERGAEAGDLALDDLFSRLGARQVRLIAAVAVAATAAFLVTAYVLPDGGDAETLEAEAEVLRQSDPLAAAQRYLDLSEEAPRIEDRVGYLVEAAVLSEAGEDEAQATRLYARALEVAGDDQTLAASVQMRRASFALEQGAFAEAMADAAEAMAVSGQPAEQRARAVLLFERAAEAAGEDPEPPVAALLASLAEVPDSAGQLRVALAELRSSRGDTEAALAELDAAAALTLPSDITLRMLETRARVLDRAGDLAGSAETLEALMADSAPEALMYQAASLQLADLRQRQGQTDAALEIIARLDGVDLDPQIQGRAMLVTGRIYESAGQTEDAARTYQQLLGLSSMEVDVQEEARVGLARLLLSEDGGALAEAALADLPDGFAAQVMAQARLGDARRLLDEGDAAGALALYDEVLAAPSLPEELERAASAGRGEALASLGRAAEAEEVWRALIATGELPASEKVYLELLLANGMLQGGKRAEAEAAFISLASATDPEIRAQGRLGLAEVARAAGERERARGLYQQVADEAPDPAWRVQALQELADLAVEEGSSEDAQAAWRAVLGLAGAGDPAAVSARLSLVESFADAGSADDARRLCQEAIAGAPGPVARQGARQTCAEALERAGLRDDALSLFREQQAEDGLSDEGFAEAALGIARIQGRRAPDEALAAARAGLARCKDPATTLQLITHQLQAATALGDLDALAEAESARRELASSSPRLAARLLIESAAAAQEAGDLSRALALLEQAAEMALPRLEAASVALELGGVLAARGDTAEAREQYERALAADDTQLSFAAGMGLADLERRRGDPRAAIRRYDSLDAPDPGAERWLLEARAAAMTEAGDPEALEQWAELTDQADDPSMRSSALRGQADTLLAQDRFDEAIARYTQAADAAVEPSAAGWARLGAAEALRLKEDPDAARALLRELAAHPDAEVSLQAAIQRARLELGAEQPEAALAALEGRTAVELGPGWDATLAEVRVAALTAAGQSAAAEAELEALAARWPDEEEAQLPAWLGLADLARAVGDIDEAKEWAAMALSSARDPAYRDRALDIVEQLDRQ